MQPPVPEPQAFLCQPNTDPACARVLFQPGVITEPQTKAYRCRRDTQCTATFTSSYAQNRHERSRHSTADNVSLCPTCNLEILKHLFTAHVNECVKGTVVVKKQRLDSQATVAATLTADDPQLLRPLRLGFRD